MTSPLTYRPVYLGLYAALVLAIACNTFLDIQYGSFSTEVLIWAGVLGYTLWVGWKQKGLTSDYGRNRQKVVLAGSIVLTIVFFMPVWGLPRAGLYLLGGLQASLNCVTTTRRNLHMGLLVSMVMVIFAASHYRADWTMLFYLLPYIVAVVFTLVAEQISRRTEDLNKDGPGSGTTTGQGAAIAAATAAILLIGGLLYSVTPQITRPTLFWQHGQPGTFGTMGPSTQNGESGMQTGEGPGSASGSAQHERWPTAGEMRKAAQRPGMPQWQSSVINALAELVEATERTLTPIRLGLEERWNDIKQWLEEHRKELALTLLTLLLLALIAAAWRLLREMRPGVWLRTRIDYLHLGLLEFHAPGNAGARQYYVAFSRLLDLHGVERLAAMNSRDYLAQVCQRFRDLRREFVELTLIFEKARYGNVALSPNEVQRMRTLYQQVFAHVRRAP